MNRLWNRCARYWLNHFGTTGLEQELNRGEITGQLAVPALAQAARQMAAEGIVLLKNDRQTLPIRPQDRVAVFGRTAADYFTVGYGSGGDVIPPYKSGLMDGLRSHNVMLDEELAKNYSDWCTAKRNVPDEGYWGHWPMSYPEMPLTDRVVVQAAQRSQLAVVVIGRAAGEDRENLLKKGSYYLTDRELSMLDRVTAHFDRVCVVMDCGNIIDMSWTMRYGDKIGALVYAWQGGMESGYALADVLTGAVSPSGCLTDTIAVQYSDYPGSDHFGGKEFNDYVEDIYVGYRYFETFCPQKVLYPFGFGLSYTTFDLQTQAKQSGNRIELEVQVTNTGSCSGKRVVQSYLCLPCGSLGNPAKVLAAFAKTDTLQPGQSQTLQLQIDLAQFAPYDDSGVTGQRSCFVLEAGVYGVEVGTDVRSAERVLTFEKLTGEIVCRTREAIAVKPDKAFHRLINRGGAPEYEAVSTATKDLKQQVLSELPVHLTTSQQGISFADVVAGRHSAEDFVAQLTPEELDEITHGQGKMNSCYGISGNAGAFGGVTERLRRRGLPAMTTTDGPSGLRIRRTVCLLPCGTALASSFNLPGVEALYELVGQEMLHFDTHMLLAPGMNLHRNPLCGRNFEYFSEDPFLTGKMAAAVVRGVQHSGRSACPKHFACNNQEKHRNTNDSRVSERALRELYLKGFEIVVKEASPLAIMTSYNKVNGVWSHYHYELVTQLLRQEWGYDGLVITDWWMQEGTSEEFPQISNDAYRVRAQVDVLMPGELMQKKKPQARTLLSSLEHPDGITLGEAQRSALNVVNFILKIERRKNGNSAGV